MQEQISLGDRIKELKNSFIFSLLLLKGVMFATISEINPSPISILKNFHSAPSLVNSVDFHPTLNRFCVSYTHNHSVVIYEIQEDESVKIIHKIEGFDSFLKCPQHALFSKDGNSLIVVNWCSQLFTIYNANNNGVFSNSPHAIIPFQLPRSHFRPHGMAFSPDGNYLAVAFGASKWDPKAVAIYKVDNLQSSDPKIAVHSFLQGDEILNGIPKGIAFTPDGKALLVTFSQSSSIAIYEVDPVSKNVNPNPKEIINDLKAEISRPEDVKFTVDGLYCAVTNSDKNTISFYDFNEPSSTILSYTPSFVLKNPESELSFPHGIAFSPDGKYLVVTQFGPVIFDKNDNLSAFGFPRKDVVSIYKLHL